MCIICPTLSTVFYTFVLVYFSTFKHSHLFATYLPVLGPLKITLGQAWQVLVLQQNKKIETHFAQRSPVRIAQSNSLTWVFQLLEQEDSTCAMTRAEIHRLHTSFA